MRYVAFLRAINTGRRRIKMADLRALYVDMGYAGVSTHIATGNVIFEAPSPPLPADLESRFLERFGFESEVYLRTADEVLAVLDGVPWRNDDAVVEVSFLEREPGAVEARNLEETAVDPEALAVVGRELFFLRGLGRGAPTIHKESTSMRVLSMTMTRRSLTTVQQLSERFLLSEP